MPFTFFVSLSANEYTLPTTSNSCGNYNQYTYFCFEIQFYIFRSRRSFDVQQQSQVSISFKQDQINRVSSGKILELQSCEDIILTIQYKTHQENRYKSYIHIPLSWLDKPLLSYTALQECCSTKSLNCLIKLRISKRDAIG